MMVYSDVAAYILCEMMRDEFFFLPNFRNRIVLHCVNIVNKSGIFCFEYWSTELLYPPSKINRQLINSYSMIFKNWGIGAIIVEYRNTFFDKWKWILFFKCMTHDSWLVYTTIKYIYIYYKFKKNIFVTFKK